MENSNCSCNDCKSMCLNSPCFPTPEDVIRLENNVFGDDLMFTIYVNPLKLELYPLVAPKSTSIGKLINKCTFLNNEGLCELHNLGLKPTEGKLAIHGKSEEHSIQIRTEICETWDSELGRELLLKYNGSDDYQTKIDDIKTQINEYKTQYLCGMTSKD